MSSSLASILPLRSLFSRFPSWTCHLLQPTIIEVSHYVAWMASNAMTILTFSIANLQQKYKSQKQYKILKHKNITKQSQNSFKNSRKYQNPKKQQIITKPQKTADNHKTTKTVDNYKISKTVDDLKISKNIRKLQKPKTKTKRTWSIRISIDHNQQLIANLQVVHLPSVSPSKLV